MKERPEWFRRMCDTAEDVIPGLPIVELGGNRRVLIEGHGGIEALDGERIVVKMPYGAVCVTGQGLRIQRVSREDLLICGKILGITVSERGGVS